MNTPSDVNTTPSTESLAAKRKCTKYTRRFLIDVFQRLDDKNRSGVGGMPASTMVQLSYHLSREDSDELTLGWIHTFSDKKSVENRVDEYMAIGVK